MLFGLRVGARRQPDIVGVADQAGPHLGAVDHPVAVVAHRPGFERGQVGAGVGLAVADGEVHLAAQDPRQKVFLLLLAAELHQRGTDRVDGEEGDRHTGALRFVEEDELLDRGAPLAAPLLGPADAQPAVLPQLARQVLVDRPRHLAPPHHFLDLGRDQPGEVGAQLLLQSLLGLGQRNAHFSPPPSPSG